jgi:hypothetical protein
MQGPGERESGKVKTVRGATTDVDVENILDDDKTRGAKRKCEDNMRYLTKNTTSTSAYRKRKKNDEEDEDEDYEDGRQPEEDDDDD